MLFNQLLTPPGVCVCVPELFKVVKDEMLPHHL